MTVQELIVELNKMPPDMIVIAGARRLNMVEGTLLVKQVKVVVLPGGKPWYTMDVTLALTDDEIPTTVVNIY